MRARNQPRATTVPKLWFLAWVRVPRVTGGLEATVEPGFHPFFDDHQPSTCPTGLGPQSTDGGDWDQPRPNKSINDDSSVPEQHAHESRYAVQNGLLDPGRYRAGINFIFWYLQ